MPPQTGPTEARLKLAARMAELTADGYTQTEAGEILGISRSYASALVTDPDGSAARRRKDGYSKPCPKCGNPMSGSDGRNKAPAACHECVDNPRLYWTRELVIERFQRFAKETGRAPATSDRMGNTPSQRAVLSDERKAEIDAAADLIAELPIPGTVQDLFGSWAAAIQAAGLTQQATGGRGHRGPRRQARQLRVRLDAIVSYLTTAGPSRVADLPELPVGRRTRDVYLLDLVRAGRIERPRKGVYMIPGDTRPLPERKLPMRDYHVFRQASGNRTWILVDTVPAATPDSAIEKVADKEGTYVALTASMWNPTPVKTQSRLTVVKPALTP